MVDPNAEEGENNQNVVLVQSNNPLNLNPPPPLSLEGNISEKWKKWKKKFKIYMEAIESSAKPDDAKVIILLYSIGEEAQEVYETFELEENIEDKYKAVLDAFKNYCVPKKNESVCRHVFFHVFNVIEERLKNLCLN